MLAASSSGTQQSTFTRLHKLGEGTYGVVYKAREKSTGKLVALKKIKLDGEENGMPSTSLREIAVLKELKHPNIVALLDIIYGSATDLQLVFEFLDRDLRKHMEEHRQLDSATVKSFTWQLLAGLEFCHARRVIHRDLKPQNLLIDKGGRLKIADFGLARCFGVPLRPYTHEVVTLWYRAPEVLLGVKTYSIPLDMWSVGCIVAEMVTHQPLFAGDSEIDQLFKIFQVLGTPNEGVWPGISELPDYKAHFPRWSAKDMDEVLMHRMGREGVALVGEMLTYWPGSRMSARSAMKHAYFNGFTPPVFDDE